MLTELKDAIELNYYIIIFIIYIKFQMTRYTIIWSDQNIMLMIIELTLKRFIIIVI